MAVLDRFNGSSNFESWIYRAEQYFTCLGFSEKDWLPLPYFYLDGEALAWFTWLHRNKQFFDWTHFKEKLRIRFGQRAFTDSVSREDTSRAGVDYVSYNPAFPQPISASPVATLSHDPNSSDLKAAFNNGNSQEANVFDNLSNRADKCDSRELPSSIITSSTIVNYHLDTIQGLMMAMMDNNKHMLRILGSIENKLSPSSKTIPLTPEHSGVVLYLEETRKSEEVSAPLVIEESALDFNLDKGLSSPVDKPEVLHEPVNPMANSSNSLHFSSLGISFGCTGTSNTPLGTKNIKEEQLRNYTCKVFAETTDKKIDMNDEDSVQNDSVKPETQVFYKVFQTVAAACGHDQHIGRGAFDYLSVLGYAKLILSLHQCPPDQFKLCFPFDPGSSLFAAFLGTTRNDIYCGALSILNYDKFRTLTLWNSCISPLELQFKRTNRVCTYVFLALGLVSVVRHMWTPLKETDLERVYMFELEKATQWKGLEFFLIGEKDHGLGMIFYRPMVSAAANNELFMLMSNIMAHSRKLDTAAKTMHMIEATNKAKCTITMSMRSLGRRVVEKIIADNSEAHSPFDLDYIGDDIFRIRSSCGFYIPRTITGRVKMPFSGEKVFLKRYGSGGLQNGINIFLSCDISDMFSISCASLIFNKMPGKVPLRWNIVVAFTPYVCTEKAELSKIISMAAVISQSLVYQVFLMLKFLGFQLDVQPHMSLSTAPGAFLLLVAWYNDGLGFHFNLSTARLLSSLASWAQQSSGEINRVLNGWQSFKRKAESQNTSSSGEINRVLNGWQSFKRNAESQNTSSSSSKNSSNLLSSSMLHYLNLEDKVLIEDESIVMNQPQSNIGLRRVIGPRRSQRDRRPSKRLIWDPGPQSTIRSC